MAASDTVRHRPGRKPAFERADGFSGTGYRRARSVACSDELHQRPTDQFHGHARHLTVAEKLRDTSAVGTRACAERVVLLGASSCGLSKLSGLSAQRRCCKTGTCRWLGCLAVRHELAKPWPGTGRVADQSRGVVEGITLHHSIFAPRGLSWD